jgi:hypothetical protein
MQKSKKKPPRPPLRAISMDDLSKADFASLGTMSAHRDRVDASFRDRDYIGLAEWLWCYLGATLDSVAACQGWPGRPSHAKSMETLRKLVKAKEIDADAQKWFKNAEW